MNIRNLVISGGGINGLSFIGALDVLYNRQCLNHVEKYAGTSIGAIICALLCIYTPAQLIKELTGSVLLSVEDLSVVDLQDKFGIDNGNRAFAFFNDLVTQATDLIDPTLLEFHEFTNKDLFITGTNLSQITSVYFNHKTASIDKIRQFIDSYFL